jgi:hypothetical protein
MKTITISQPKDKQIVDNVITTMLEKHKKLSVTIKKFEQNHSAEQKRLYFKWIDIIARDIGYTKDEMHNEYKKMFLVDIYSADPEGHPQYEEYLTRTRATGDSVLINGMAREASITSATVKNMSDYLNEIKNHATGLGIMLPLPEMQGIL